MFSVNALLPKPKFPQTAEPTLFEQVKDPQPRGLHVYLVRRDDHISWSRPMSVHERANSGLGLRRPAGMGRAWAKMQR
jgi:hypothetical protein